MPRLILFANGLIADYQAARGCVRPDDTLMAADGGTRHALALGWLPSVIIGDLDSLAPQDRLRLEANGCDIRAYPRDKDETDLELALDFARQAGYGEICILGGLGGRLDQTLGNLGLLTRPEFAALDVRMDDGVEEAFFSRSRADIHGKAGDIVSLLPWGGEVRGVSVDGLRWPLHGETLFAERTRGISNEMTGETASIRLESGLLLVVHRRINYG